MAHSRRITLSALNIALHEPHPIEQYVDLLQKAFQQRSIIRLGSLHGAMLGTLSKPRALEKITLMSGEIYRFVKLDALEQWFNTAKKEPATNEDVEAINIPSHLLPHLQRIPFVFNVRKHKLWFVSRDQKNSFAPPIAMKFMDSLLQSAALKFDFPEVSVTSVPDSTSVGNILSLPGLEYLKIELIRPNPDDGENAEARWLRRMEKQRTTKARLELFHAKNVTLEPDAETRDMAEVAANNGSVYGRGRTADGLLVEDSTKDRPMLRQEFVNTKIETAADVLERAAVE